MTQIKSTVGFVRARAENVIRSLGTSPARPEADIIYRCRQLLDATKSLHFTTEMLVSVEDMLILQKG